MTEVSERAFDQADRQAGQERAAGIAAAMAALGGAGADECIACGMAMGAARRRAMPSAVRCVDCQEIHERRMW